MAGGRPTDYRPEYVDLGYKFALLGGTMDRIAKCFDVNKDTLYEWMKIYPEFSDAINKGRQIANAEVAASLYKRAIGFDVIETTYEKLKGKEGLEIDETGDITEGDQWKVKVTKKHIVPDVAAGVVFLKNRDREGWSDRQIIEQSGPNGDPVKVEHVIKFEDMGSGDSDTKTE